MKINPEIRDVMTQAADQLREALEFCQRAKNMKLEAENEIIMRMFNEIFSSDKPLSAKEISARLNGDMSWQEVSGQMVVTTHPWDNRYPKHGPASRVKSERAISRTYRTTTKVFAELDENGNIKKGGDTVIKTKTNVVYEKAK